MALAAKMFHYCALPLHNAGCISHTEIVEDEVDCSACNINERVQQQPENVM